MLNNIQACGTSGQHLNVGAHRNQDQNLKKTSGNRCGHVPSALILLVKKILPERLPYQVKNAIDHLEEISKLHTRKIKKKTQLIGFSEKFLLHPHKNRLIRSERREVCLALLSIMAADANIRSKRLGKDSDPVRTMQHYINMVHKNARDHGRNPYSEDRIRAASKHLESGGYITLQKKYKVTETGEVRVSTEINATHHFFVDIMGCKQNIVQKDNVDALNKAPERQDRPYYQIAKIEPITPTKHHINNVSTTDFLNAHHDKWASENKSRVITPKEITSALKDLFKMPSAMPAFKGMPSEPAKKLTLQEEIELQMSKFRQKE